MLYPVKRNDWSKVHGVWLGPFDGLPLVLKSPLGVYIHAAHLDTYIGIRRHSDRGIRFHSMNRILH